MWYFAYGSNLCQGRLLGRVATARYDRIARLPGHDFRFHKRGRDASGKADAFPTGSQSDAVWGVLVGLNETELSTLDNFEPGYDRLVLEVELPADGSMCRASVYIAQPAAVDASLLPFSWYRQLVVAGGAARGLPDEYLARIAAMPVGSDQHAGPRGDDC